MVRAYIPTTLSQSLKKKAAEPLAPFRFTRVLLPTVFDRMKL